MLVLLVNGKNCQTGALMMNQKGKSKAVFGLQFPRKEIRGYCNLLIRGGWKLNCLHFLACPWKG